MRFIDEAEIRVQSGKGGNGVVSFRREKFIAMGGPDGGDGGRGGDVVLQADEGCNTLLELRSQPVWRAEDGERGGAKQMTGASGADHIVRVPLGTQVFAPNGTVPMADLTAHGDRYVAAKGGDGGLGNMHFKTSTNRAPRRCQPGWDGEERELRLELSLMADVGLLGFPNAGKSTFITVVSAARPKVADYPFTTLVPSLGVVDMGVEGSFVVADIPGLIEGASEGAGLGHRFLRHLSRTRLLLHLISLGPDEELKPSKRYKVIRRELLAYDPELAARPEVIVLTKTDVASPETLAKAHRSLVKASGTEAIYHLSAVTGEGLRELTRHLWTRLQEMPKL
jgi:GTP-binding protein